MAKSATQEATDSGQSDATDTSTDAGNQDTEALDIDDPNLGDDWDSDDSDESGQDDETEGDEKTDEDEQASDSEEETESEAEDDADDKDESDNDESEESNEEESDDTKSDDDKKVSDSEAAQRRIEEREQKRQQLKVKRQQEYLDEATDAADLTVRQLQIDTYNNRVLQVTNQLHTNLNAAIATPGLTELFNSRDPAIREEMITAVDDFEKLHVRLDQNEDVVEVRGDITKYLQERAARIRKLTGIGAKKQVQDKKTQKKRSLTPPSRSPKKGKSDPMMDAFDEEAGL